MKRLMDQLSDAKKQASRTVRFFGLLLAVLFVSAPALAADPIKLGFSMALSGGLASNGKAALLAIKMWSDEVNAKGGLLGRKIDLVYYDDQSNPSTVPGIYTKLISVDKVDLVVSPYGTNLIAPAMPVVMQAGYTMMSLFGVGVNNQFQYDGYFQIMPMGPQSAAAIPTGFFDIAMGMNPKPKTVALVAADAEFGQVTIEASREIVKKLGLKVVYDRSYPPNTVDFASIVRSIQASSPDVVFMAGYPPDSVGMVRAAREVGLKTMLFGGGNAGLQFASIKSQLGPLLNGIIGYELYVPSPTLNFPGIKEFIGRYQQQAVSEGVDPLGFYAPPFVYAAVQVLGQAVEKTGSLDQKALAATMHQNSFETVVGKVKFAPNGEWDKARVLLVQYQGITDNNVDQFRKEGIQAVLYPPEFKSGNLQTPFQDVK